MKDNTSQLLLTLYRLDRQHDEYYDTFVNKLKSIVSEVDPPFTLNHTFTEYFAKNFVYGKELYDNINDFNIRLINRIKADEALVNALLRGIPNGELIQDNFKLSSGKRVTLRTSRFAKPNSRRNANNINYYVDTDYLSGNFKIQQDLDENYNAETNQMIIDNYLGLYMKLQMNYIEGRHSYLQEVVDLENVCDYCIIGTSNYKDARGVINQAIELTLQCQDTAGKDSSIIFYYTSDPNDTTVYNYNDAANGLVASPSKFIMCHKYYEDNSDYFAGKNRCKTYKLNVPIFNDEDLKYLRFIEWTLYRPFMEDDGATSFYKEKVEKYSKDCENNHKLIRDELYKNYPWLNYNHEDTQNEVFVTNWRIKMFMSKINEILTRIVEQTKNNPIVQCNNFLQDGYISSRDALIPAIFNNRYYLDPFDGITDERSANMYKHKYDAICEKFHRNFEYLLEYTLFKLRKEYLNE